MNRRSFIIFGLLLCLPVFAAPQGGIGPPAGHTGGPQNRDPIPHRRQRPSNQRPRLDDEPFCG